MKKQTIVTAALDIATAIMIFSAAPLTDWMLQNGKPCFSYKMGIICPACGGTHSVNSFFKGEFAAAFHYNPAVFVAMLYLLMLLALVNAEPVFSGGIVTKIRKLAVHPVTLCALCLTYTVVGFARNL